MQLLPSTDLATPFTVSVVADRLLHCDRARELLNRHFGAEFSILGEDQSWLHVAQAQPALQDEAQLARCKECIASSRPQIVAQQYPLALLAIPLKAFGADGCVAIATFRTSDAAKKQDTATAWERLGLERERFVDWDRHQAAWSAETLLIVADLLIEQRKSSSEIAILRKEVDDLSQQLSSTYEEICLLFRLTQNLKISSSVEELAQFTLNWLAEIIPAEALVIQLTSRGDCDVQSQTVAGAKHITYGACPVKPAVLTELVERVGTNACRQPFVVNPPVTNQPDWALPELQQFVLVPLTEGDNVFGWLMVINHCEGREFGTVEANLLSSVASILGIHAGNLDLYRQQAEFLSGVVRALTSAIDAKDPYTCGHSDRVARVSMRLAQELGCSEEEVNTIYLSGLLHDVGKIGINDVVLRKPGRLTDEEFEHIKTHAETGYRILRDLKQLDNILPVVRHHHEAWNGTGYPMGLAGNDIPLMARIVSVADAFDAMSSNRPYRPGMPDEKLDAIMREGAGVQWDAKIVEAFFRARDDIRAISLRERESLQLPTFSSS